MPKKRLNTVAQPEQYGWVCPVCGRGLSPFTVVCPCKNGEGWKITCNDDEMTFSAMQKGDK